MKLSKLHVEQVESSIVIRYNLVRDLMGPLEKGAGVLPTLMLQSQTVLVIIVT